MKLNTTKFTELNEKEMQTNGGKGFWGPFTNLVFIYDAANDVWEGVKESKDRHLKRIQK